MASNQDDRSKQPLPATSGLKGIVILAAVVAVVAVVYWVVIAPMISPLIAPNPEVHAGIGKRLSFLELRPLTGDGPPISQRDLRDHVTLLNFWGTWCPPCREELPHIAELQQRFSGQEAFRLLAVSCPSDGPPNDVQSLHDETAGLLRRLGLAMPTYYDPDDETQIALSKLIVLKGYPTTVLLDRQGVIRAIWEGYRPETESEMERYIGKLLDENR